MKKELHNPDYILISVTIDGKEFVFGEDQNGQNKGLEVYHGVNAGDEKGFTRSYRYKEGHIPQIYNELYNNLKKVSADHATGYKVTLTGADYRGISKGILTIN